MEIEQDSLRTGTARLSRVSRTLLKLLVDVRQLALQASVISRNNGCINSRNYTKCLWVLVMS